jgi:adenylate kinase
LLSAGRFVFLGPPGAGKGTQAALLARRLGIPHISTGEILRAEIESRSELGRKAEQVVESGGLVPDDLVIEMVEGRLSAEDAQRGFVLDGFPRTIAQAESLEGALAGQGKTLDAVIVLDLTEEEIVERLSERRTCPECGMNYNMKTQPPAREGFCDKCGGRLVRRADDEPETIRARLRAYRQETEKLIEFYRERALAVLVSASGSVAQTAEEINKVADDKIRC